MAITVDGIVQGVGFRPFVHQLALRLGLAGFVGNDVHGVFVEAEGPMAQIEAFAKAIEAHAPPLAVVERVEMRKFGRSGIGGSGSLPARTPGPPTR